MRMIINRLYGLRFSNIIKENSISCKNLDSESITLDLAFDSVEMIEMIEMIEMFLNISIQICLRTIFFHTNNATNYRVVKLV